MEVEVHTGGIGGLLGIEVGEEGVGTGEGEAGAKPRRPRSES